VDVRPGSVREARQEAGLSLARLAGQEISRGAIYLIERGRSRPSMATLDLIAERTGKPVSFFLVEEPGPAARREAADEVAVSEGLLREGRFQEAAAAAEAIIDASAGAPPAARARLVLARASLGAGRADAAALQAELARGQFLELDDPWTAAECQALLARATHLVSEDHRELALAYAEQAIADCEALDPVPGLTLAAACTTAADVLAGQERWELAAERYRRALDVVDALSDPALLADLYDRLGSAYEARERADLAAVWMARAGVLRDAWRELGVIPEIHLKLAATLRGGGAADAAMRELGQALRESERLRLPGARGRALLTQADWHLAAGELDLAERPLRGAAEIARQAGDRRALARARCLDARLAAGRGDAAARDAAFDEALELHAGLGDQDELVGVHVAYAELLEASGEVGRALAHWKAAMLIARPHMGHAAGPLPAQVRPGAAPALDRARTG